MSRSSHSGHSSSGSSFTQKTRYMQAIRDGPGRYPDHILVNHPEFVRDRPSPYMLFYYDITAPNPILLENDVVRDARLRKSKPTTVKYWREDPPMAYQESHSATSPRHSSSSYYTYVTYSSDMAPRGSASSQKAKVAVPKSDSMTSESSRYSYTYASDHKSVDSSAMRSGPQSQRSSVKMVATPKSTVHSTTEESHQLMYPDLRRASKRDLKYSKKELYFNAHQHPGLDEVQGTVYSHLPQYSTSYKNYPNIAFDVVNPRNYREFYNERHTPGFFTAHRPTNHKVQGRRAEKMPGY